jgi:hypothetical protein
MEAREGGSSHTVRAENSDNRNNPEQSTSGPGYPFKASDAGFHPRNEPADKPYRVERIPGITQDAVDQIGD